MSLKGRARKEAKKDPQLGGQWKVPSLVVLNRNLMFRSQ